MTTTTTHFTLYPLAKVKKKISELLVCKIIRRVHCVDYTPMCTPLVLAKLNQRDKPLHNGNSGYD